MMAGTMRGLILALFTAAFWSTGGAAFAEKRLALVVGINSYPALGDASQLQRAVADAASVGDALQDLGFKVARVTNGGGLDDILAAYDRLRAEAGPSDLVVFYFAGHGISLDDGNYLVPADVPALEPNGETLAKRRTIPERDISAGLLRTGAKVVLVLDACRDNPFPVRGTRSLGASTRGLARLAPEQGVYALYAASEGQAAVDRLGDEDSDAHSLFTRVFLKELRRPGVSIIDMGERVRDEVAEVARAAGRDQVPAAYNSLLGARNLFLAGSGGGPRPPEPALNCRNGTTNVNGVCAASPVPVAKADPLPERPAPAKPRDICAEASDQAVVAPIRNIFQALGTLDLSLYAAQWAESATYVDASTGRTRGKSEIVAAKQASFARWTSVQTRLSGPSVMSHLGNRATVANAYSLAIQTRDGRTIQETAREDYSLVCGSDGRWTILVNRDYAR